MIDEVEVEKEWRRRGSRQGQKRERERVGGMEWKGKV